jgi:hypothetical protein
VFLVLEAHGLVKRKQRRGFVAALVTLARAGGQVEIVKEKQTGGG